MQIFGNYPLRVCIPKEYKVSRLGEALPKIRERLASSGPFPFLGDQ